MDALSIIDRKTQVVAAAPANPVKKNEQEFGKVLKEKQQTHQPQENKPQERKEVDKQSQLSANSQDKQAVAHDCKTGKTEMTQEKAGSEEPSAEVVEESGLFAETNPQPQVKVLHTLVELKKMIAAVAQDNSAEQAESFNTIEKLLTDLVGQLESTELSGEQVLAGVDLSSLAEEVKSLDNDSDHEALLEQLVAAIAEQLTEETSLSENGELAAAMGVEPQPQHATPVIMENLAQARQLLQRAFASVVSQKSIGADAATVAENVAEVEPSGEESSSAMAELVEQIDPRFAGLLKSRPEQRPVQQTQPVKEPTLLHNSKQPAGVNQGGSAVQIPSAEEQVKAPNVETIQLSGAAAKLTQQAAHNLQSHAQPQVQGLEMNKAMPQTQTIQLASGQHVAESQIFDQVVTQISGSVNGESGRMVLRLQPAELGSLKLELVVEGDRIRANIHAQSQQVQEVLERNLPQLRNALAEQGLKIDQFQVNVDQRQPGGQFENSAQHHNQGSEKQPGWQQQGLEPEEQFIPLAHLMQNGGGGISLHV